MASFSAITGFLALVPIIRDVVRWLFGPKVQVQVGPYYPDLGNPYSVVLPGTPMAEGSSVLVEYGSIYAFLSLRLINHRTDRAERIIGCWVELRRRKLHFWWTRLVTAEAYVQQPGGQRNPLHQLLEPLGAPVTIPLEVRGTFDKTINVPKMSYLVLVLETVGPVRKLEHVLTTVTKAMHA